MDGKAFLAEDEYTYRGRDTYLLDQYIEQVTFAKYQVQRQMEYALERKKQLALEIKSFAGLLIAYFVIFFLVNTITGTDGTLLFMAAQIVSTLLSAVGIFLIPACVFMVVKGGIIWCMDRSSEGQAVDGTVQTYQNEIQECQMYLEKYRLLLEDLYQWKREIIQGRTVSDDIVQERVQRINLKPKIQVALDSANGKRRSYIGLAIIITIAIFFLFVMKL